MKTILVSGASGIVGYGILRSLRASGENYKLVGTTIYEDSVAPAFCDIFEKSPKTNESNYLTWLLHVIKKHKVDIVIPGIEADMFKWVDELPLLIQSNVKIVLNNIDLIRLCGDKWAFYKHLILNDSSLAIPTEIGGSFEELKLKFGLPFLLKPRRGYASKGIVKVTSEEVFMEHANDIGNLLVQPIVGDDEQEYTYSAFFDNDSNLCAYMGLRRKLSKDGYTEKAHVVEIEGAKEAILKLASIFKPVGPTNFQFRNHDGQLKLLEINPRVSSSTSIRTAFGYNESLMSAKYYLEGIAPKQPQIKTGFATRYIEEFVVYDRDNF